MRISLRFKLALVSILLLAIPYTGVRLSNIVKTNLLESRKEALMFSTRAVAEALSGREGLFDQEHFHALNRNRDLYLYQLTQPMRLNGKLDDWQPHINRAQRFGADHLEYSAPDYSPNGFGFKHLTGRRGDYLYAIFLVDDDSLIYRQDNSLALDRSDHLQIAAEDRQGNVNRYIVTATKPGWINGYLISSDFETILPARNESHIQGMWETTAGGYIIELRMPLQMVGNRLAFAIADVDDEISRKIETLVGTSNMQEPDNIGWLLGPSTNIEKILESLNRPQSRIQIVDSNQHIRASYGSLKRAEKIENEDPSVAGRLHSLLRPLYQLFTEPFVSDFTDPMAQPSTLDIQGVQAALSGESTISFYRIAEGNVEIMAAITPLHENDTVIGAVVVEQTTNSILALQNKVIEESIGLTLLVLVFGGCCLLFFAFRISSRIHQLRDQASGAIGKNGQILKIAPPSNSRDEIGDLSRTLHAVLSQLKTQSQYREKMADNLEHEMRTPLAGASASLQNLARELEDESDQIRDYVKWALGDIRRMEDLLTAIRDATSLKNALLQDFKEHFNLSEALAMWLDHGWRKTFDGVGFTLKKPEEHLFLDGDPDRIRQMLDKLIENSVAFHTPGTDIQLHLETYGDYHQIAVLNEGPTIPEEMVDEIFNSMVSIRSQRDSKPHLGLGLYIVRTIALHHGGTVKVENLREHNHGVKFIIRLPRPTLISKK